MNVDGLAGEVALAARVRVAAAPVDAGLDPLGARRGPDRVLTKSAQNVSILGPHFGGPK